MRFSYLLCLTIVIGYHVSLSEQCHYVVDGSSDMLSLRRVDGIGAISGGGVSIIGLPRKCFARQ